MPCRVALMILVAALLAAVPVDRAPAQGRIAATHGDWQIRCERPVGAPGEQCALIQNVEAADRPNVSLTVLFLLTADRQARILRVLAPLGVLLPPGLGLSIDANEIGVAGFVRCLPDGCIAEVELDDGLIERFEAGGTATFVIFQTPEEGIGIPISLDGFTAGFAALQDPPPAGETAEPAGPSVPVETSTRVVDAEAGAPAQPGFSIPPDDRTALDRLLEDDLFPVVAAVAGGVLLLLVGGLWLLLKGRGRRRRPRDQEEDLDEDEFDEDEFDEDEEEDEDLSRPRRPGATRVPPRLAAPAARRQLTYQPEDEPSPAARPGSRAPASPRPPRPRRTS